MKKNKFPKEVILPHGCNTENLPELPHGFQTRQPLQPHEPIP